MPLRGADRDLILTIYSDHWGGYAVMCNVFLSHNWSIDVYGYNGKKEKEQKKKKKE